MLCCLSQLPFGCPEYRAPGLRILLVILCMFSFDSCVLTMPVVVIARGDRSLIGGEGSGISDLVFDMIQAAPIDLRSEVRQSCTCTPHCARDADA